MIRGKQPGETGERGKSCVNLNNSGEDSVSGAAKKMKV